MESVKWLGLARQEPLPAWAFGRPRPVVTTLLDRLAKGSSGTFLITVADLNMGAFLANFKGCLNESSLNYNVDIKAGTCSCPDQTQKRMVCKHIFAVLHHHSSHVSFQDLPFSLVGAPSLNLTAGPAAVARFVHKKIIARARREKGRRMGVAGPCLGALT